MLDKEIDKKLGEEKELHQDSWLRNFTQKYRKTSLVTVLITAFTVGYSLNDENPLSSGLDKITSIASKRELAANLISENKRLRSRVGILETKLSRLQSKLANAFPGVKLEKAALVAVGGTQTSKFIVVTEYESNEVFRLYHDEDVFDKEVWVLILNAFASEDPVHISFDPLNHKFSAFKVSAETFDTPLIADRTHFDNLRKVISMGNMDSIDFNDVEIQPIGKQLNLIFKRSNNAVYSIDGIGEASKFLKALIHLARGTGDRALYKRADDSKKHIEEIVVYKGL